MSSQTFAHSARCAQQNAHQSTDPCAKKVIDWMAELMSAADAPQLDPHLAAFHPA